MRKKITRLNRKMLEADLRIEELSKKLEDLEKRNGDNNGYSIFLGNSNIALGQMICDYLKKPAGKALIGRFSDGEKRIEIKENIRKMHTYIIQSTCFPVDSNLMELLIMLDACQRSADLNMNKVAVLPYFGYARQDKKSKSRDPISAKLVSNMIKVAGATRIILLEPHFPQIQGYFDIPVDNLQIGPMAADYIKKNYFLRDVVIVSPDAGGMIRSRGIAMRISGDDPFSQEVGENLGVPVAVVDKRRTAPNKAKALRIIGDVKGKECIILDDMIDTGGTLGESACVLMEKGAKSVDAICVHPVLSGPAIDRVNSSCLRHLIVTNTIPLKPEAQKCPKIKVLSVHKLIGEGIRRSYTGESVSSLFE